MVAANRYVFRRHQPFIDGCRHTALQDHRLVDAADFLEQIEVLHVASADLNGVDVVLEKGFEHARIHQLCDDRQTMGVGRRAQELKAFDTLALESVRAGARLEGASAHQSRACSLHTFRRSGHLLSGLDGTGPAYYLHRVATDRNARDVDHRVLPVPFAGHDLVLLDDVHRFLDAGHRIEHFRIEDAFVTDGADERSLRAAGNVHRQSVRADLCFDRFDLLAARLGLHDYDHDVSPPKKNRAAFEAARSLVYSLGNLPVSAAPGGRPEKIAVAVRRR